MSKRSPSDGKRRFGAHTSIAGALENAAAEAVALGSNALQIFSHSPRMWQAAPLDPVEIAKLAAARKLHDLKPLVVHGSYLLNLAAADPENRAKSVRGFREEVDRAQSIGAEYLVIHPGSAKGHSDPEHAVAALADAFAEATDGLRWGHLMLLLENTAGGGASLGRTFQELDAIRTAIRRLKRNAPIGYCLDTCHLYAAGYDISTAAGLSETLAEADRTLDLDRVKVIHFNDSKTKLGSRLDRHARIGEGRIGRQAMQRFAGRPELRDKAFILETPHDPDGTHTECVKILRSFLTRR